MVYLKERRQLEDAPSSCSEHQNHDRSLRETSDIQLKVQNYTLEANNKKVLTNSGVNSVLKSSD